MIELTNTAIITGNTIEDCTDIYFSCGGFEEKRGWGKDVKVTGNGAAVRISVTVPKIPADTYSGELLCRYTQSGTTLASGTGGIAAASFSSGGQTAFGSFTGNEAQKDSWKSLFNGYLYSNLSVLNQALLAPFVDSKGNFGKVYSRDMSYAASRYTEAKLARICSAVFEIGRAHV